MKKCLRNESCNCPGCKSGKKFMSSVNEIVNKYDKTYIETYTKDMMLNNRAKKYPSCAEEYKHSNHVSLWCAAWLKVNDQL